MRSILVSVAVTVAALVVACASPSSEDQSSSQSRQVVTTPGGPKCGPSWGCAQGMRPVTDKELFTALKELQVDGAEGEPDPNVAALAVLECGRITNSCDPSSCSIQTACGSGGPVMGDQASIIDNWLQVRHVPVETQSFASRRRATDVVCIRSSVNGEVSCSFSASGSSATH